MSIVTKTFISILGGVALAASAAQAMNKPHASHHDAKPIGLYHPGDEGHIIVVGRVASSVNQANTIKVEDQYGKHFNIHTNRAVSLDGGDYVRVSGITTDKEPSRGATIKDAQVQSIQPLNAARTRGRIAPGSEQRDYDVLNAM